MAAQERYVRSPILGPAASPFVPAEAPKGAAGSLLDSARLTQISAMLKAIDAGDRIIKGRVELFSCSRRRLSQNQQRELQARVPHSLADSALGPLSTEPAQLLLANLRALMSLLFPDYDCTGLTPDDFEHCPDKHTVVGTINHSLAAVVDRVHTGFLGEFWQVVQETIDLVNCEVYAFRPTAGTFEPTDSALMSSYYFFADVGKGRILFIGSVTKSRASVRNGLDSDSDAVLSSPMGSSVTSEDKEFSELGSNMHDGSEISVDDDD
mmetsp:Transcript_77736/g.219843  ORF Transcript_77736/g.219843 Transcript_77736/m.219843 type:complete len:266 (-) Transcript_77736:54-851(-)